MGSDNKLTLMVIAAGVWMLVLSNLIRSPDPVSPASAAQIEAGVKAALNACRVIRDGRFQCIDQ